MWPIWLGMGWGGKYTTRKTQKMETELAEHPASGWGLRVGSTLVDHMCFLFA